MAVSDDDKPRTAQRRWGIGLSVPKAADALNVNLQAMRAAIRNGDVEVVQFGGMVCVPPAEIERLKRKFAVE